MKAVTVIAILAAIIPSTSFAQSESADQLMACYHSGATLDDKYSCMGSTVAACNESAEAGIVACLNAETEAWQDLMAQEIVRIVSTLEDRPIISGPCTGNQDGCIMGLKNLVSDDALHAELKCAEEASPKHNGGHPEMAAGLCNMREAARATIRVLNFGVGMGQPTAD